MVSINPAMMDKVKSFASNAFNKLAENPAEGSIFDAFKKLGINNVEDLKAGIELYKEDPKAALATAAEDLKEQGFGKATPKMNFGSMGATGAADGAEGADKNKAFTQKFMEKGLLGIAAEKLEIEDKGDIKALLDKLKANPNDASKEMIAKLGGSDQLGEKVGKLATKFLA